MSQLADIFLGGMGQGQRLALGVQEMANRQTSLGHDGQRLAMLQAQMRRDEEMRLAELTRERAARAWNMQRLGAFAPQDPSAAGAWSQTMDAFSALPSRMQGDELGRMRDDQERQRQQTLVTSFLQKVRAEGLNDEADALAIEYETTGRMPGTSIDRFLHRDRFDAGKFEQELMGQAMPMGPSEVGPPASLYGQEQVANLVRMGVATGRRPTPSEAGDILFPRTAAQKQGRDPITGEMVAAGDTPEGMAALYNAGAIGSVPASALRPDSARPGAMRSIVVNDETKQRANVPAASGEVWTPRVRDYFIRLATPLIVRNRNDGRWFTNETDEEYQERIYTKAQDLAATAGWNPEDIAQGSPDATGQSGGDAIDRLLNSLSPEDLMELLRDR